MSQKTDAIEKMKMHIRALEKVDGNKFHYIHLHQWADDVWLIGFPRDFTCSKSDQISFAILSASFAILSASKGMSKNSNKYFTFSMATMWGVSATYTFSMSYHTIDMDSTIIKPIELSELPLYIGEYLHEKFEDFLNQR